MRGAETEWQRLIDVVRDKKMVSPGLEVILRIWRLPRSFRGAHGGFAPPPSSYTQQKTYTPVLLQLNHQ